MVVEAEYELIDASVKAQVRSGNSGPWYDIKWRSTEQLSTLYSIHSANYTQLPMYWEGTQISRGTTIGWVISIADLKLDMNYF